MNQTRPFDDQSAVRRERLQGFKRIAFYYRNIYETLDRSGEMPYRLTRLGAWATSRAAHVFKFFRKLDLGRYSLCLDLGSGDGIVSCIAGLFTRSVGIEVDEALCKIASKAVRDLELEETVSFVCADYLMQRIERADCLYIYPEKPLYHLETRLDLWQGTLLVYGHHFPTLHFLPHRHLQCGREQLVVYQRLKAEG